MTSNQEARLKRLRELMTVPIIEPISPAEHQAMKRAYEMMVGGVKDRNLVFGSGHEASVRSQPSNDVKAPGAVTGPEPE